MSTGRGWEVTKGELVRQRRGKAHNTPLLRAILLNGSKVESKWASEADKSGGSSSVSKREEAREKNNKKKMINEG